ncbi:MAG: hypothetical protein LQ347_000622 [Umbilicaria vellea]|nr:MAG: hypothetical protein LQ347_000622 [Umbilicaria vellea]
MSHQVFCGCYYQTRTHDNSYWTVKNYLPQVQLEAHTTILLTTSRTTLTQTFSNPSPKDAITECIYTFPLYDGVSVVSFTCRIGSRTLHGLVKEKDKARAVYTEAVSRGETAGLLEQLPEAADVFSTTLGNIPPGEKVAIQITYVGELKHDAETDGTRFTLPTRIAPRYGSLPNSILRSGMTAQEEGGIKITVDAMVPEGSFIRSVQSPTHPIAVSMGTTSTAPKDDPALHRASATLSLGTSQLDNDFVLIVLAKDTGVPAALLETHSTIKDQRALMVTLVPKFSLPPSRPEIIFVVDRSGSMQNKMATLKSAMKVFLKSLPLGVKFNICSFGNMHSFLWTQSKPYGQMTLDEAISHVDDFIANYGGTQTFDAMMAAVESRFKDLPCEVMLLTDGEIWNQDQLFTYLDNVIQESKGGVRVFALGIGNSVSHALVEGIARAGHGFAQSVGEGEKLDSKVVRMLKGGLSPHVTDYTLEVQYEPNVDEDEEYEMVEKVTDSLQLLWDKESVPQELKQKQKPISLFDPSADTEHEEKHIGNDIDGLDRYTHLPTVVTPKLLQAPSRIPPLFPFTRTTVYLLLSPQALQRAPKTVVLRGTSPNGPLELSIPVQSLARPGETLHQLAAKKAIQELEEGRGWIFCARDENGVLVKDKFPGRFDEMVEREGVKLGVEFQTGGKWCSFVAVEANDGELADKIGMRELASQLEEDTASSTLSGNSPAWTVLDQSKSLNLRQHVPSSRIKHYATPFDQHSAFGSSQPSTKRRLVSQKLEATPPSPDFKQNSPFESAAPSQAGQHALTPSGSSQRFACFNMSAGLQQPVMTGASRQLYGSPPLSFGAAQQPATATAASSLFGSVQKLPNCSKESSNMPSYQPNSSPSGLIPQRTSFDTSLGLQQPSMQKPVKHSLEGNPFSYRASQQPPAASAAYSLFGSVHQTPNYSKEPSKMFGHPTAAQSPSVLGVQNQGRVMSSGLQRQGAVQPFEGTPASFHASQQRRGAAAASSLFGSNQEIPNYSKESSNTFGDPAAPQDRSYIPMSASQVRGGAPAQAPGSQGSRKKGRTPRCFVKRSGSEREFAALTDASDEPMPLITDEGIVHRLVDLQRFEGSWDLDDEVAAILGFNSLQQACRGEIEKLKDQKWATLLVVAFLEGPMAALEGVWELVVEKAKAWLQADGGAREGWEDETKDLVGKIGTAQATNTIA